MSELHLPGLVRLERATDTDYHYYDLFENAPRPFSRDSTAMLPASGAAMPAMKSSAGFLADFQRDDAPAWQSTDGR